MALNPEQRAVLAAIKRRAAKRNAEGKRTTPIQVKAAIETGIVESNLTNPAGGDADSQGWRQERASLYKDPRNLTASIDRFFDETAQVKDKYGRAGDLAAAVQRPAAQYRGRYQQQSGRADALMGGTSRSSGAQSGSRTTSSTRTVGGVDNRQARAAAVAAFVGDKRADPLDFALQVRSLRDVPGQKVTTTKTVKGSASSASSASSGSGQPKSKLLELFWQGKGGVDVKNGAKVPQGFVSGHTDHVHVAAGPKTVVQLGNLAQSLGLNVSENSHFNGGKRVTSGHATNSYHYKDEAIDVSGDPKLMAHYAALVAHKYGLKVKG